MFKKILLTGLVFVLLSGWSIPACATTVTQECGETTVSDEAGVRWSDTQYYKCNVSSNGNTITSTLSVIAYNTNTTISGTMYLERYDGKTWKQVTSWSVSGKGKINMSPTFNGTSGKKYRAGFSIRVGTDQINETSNEITL